VIYNMKREYVILFMMILGHIQIGIEIDVYLIPSIDDLKMF